ncbi:MAG: amidohydrolase family protein [Candidatus Heimdallarchaeota archaeon]|nr:amidohydrolase family protein [Candidatus Heimdallarchaeota archaeon]
MSEKKRLVINSGNLFDSITGTIKENQTIVIEGNQIVWVSDSGSFEKEKNDTIIESAGKTVFPGMVECHIHLSMNGEINMERAQLRTKRDMYHFYSLVNAQKQLASGFTTIRDAGSYDGIMPSLRRILDYGVFAGPRIVNSDKGVWQWGNQESVYPEALLAWDREHDQVIAGVDNVKHAIRDLKYRGATYVKTATTGGVLHGMESKVSFSLWTDEELIAIREEAHRNDMHVAAHAHGKAGIDKAVLAGFDTVEHGSFMDEESADLMIKHGTYLIPTQMAAMGLISPALLKTMPPEVQKKTIEVDSAMKTNHKMAHEKGVKIAIGTDAGTPGNYHGNSGTEIALMVKDVGMSPVQALQAATIEGAKAIWMDEKIGSIEKGKLADIIISDNNPLEDISVLEKWKNFSHIIKDGKVMVKNGILTYFSPVEKPPL